ncbi:MAG: hypothetical protein ACUVRX_07115 [Actinomycetota bacterium]
MWERIGMMGNGKRRGRVRIRVKLEADYGHCLETAARREYQRLTLAYLRGELEDSEAEERIELLREFLERADFAGLRQASERRIREGRGTAFTLFREGEEMRYGFVDEVDGADGEAGGPPG